MVAPSRRAAQGYRFECRAREALRSCGYIVDRSMRSLGPADLTAWVNGRGLAVQCKHDGYIKPGEWNSLIDYAAERSQVPVLARPGLKRGSVQFMRLTAKKTGRGRQPYEEFDISRFAGELIDDAD